MTEKLKNMRIVTPTLITVVIAILSFLVVEIRGGRAYTEKMVEKHELCTKEIITKHEARPHFITEQRMDNLDKSLYELTAEIRLLRAYYQKQARRQ